MSFCRNCGAEIQEGYAFCSACGTPVQMQAAETTVLGNEPEATFYEPQQPAYEQQASVYSAQAQPYEQQANAYQQQAQPYAQQGQYQYYNQAPQADPVVNAPYMKNPENVDQQPYQQPQGQYQPYQQPVQQGQYQQYGGGFTQTPELQEQYQSASKAKTLGIVAIIFGFLMPLVAWICGGIGISKANDAMKTAEMLGDQALVQKAKSSRTLCLVGIIIGVVIVVLGVAGMNN